MLGVASGGCLAAVIAAVYASRAVKLAEKAAAVDWKEQLSQLRNGDLRYLDGRFQQLSQQTDQQMSQLKRSVDLRLSEMRELVEDKLDHRLDRSFSQVSARLEQVYKGLGEMQQLASNVGDLKKVLSNVKTRGTLGEVQLGRILGDILAPGQYRENFSTRPGSRDVVEFAVVLPGAGEQQVYLPIDAKFPADAYAQLLDAQESGGADLLASAQKQFIQRMRVFAKDIHEKYVEPPYTTDFGILFLPFEGLYAQALQLGLLERLQRDYKVTLAGPATMAALLTSLQMGFQTLAIQQRSSEVWEVLGAVKTEFDRFSAALQATRQRLDQAGGELDRLVGSRTRMIQRKLAQVSTLEETRAARLLETEDDFDHAD